MYIAKDYQYILPQKIISTYFLFWIGPNSSHALDGSFSPLSKKTGISFGRVLNQNGVCKKKRKWRSIYFSKRQKRWEWWWQPEMGKNWGQVWQSEEIWPLLSTPYSFRAKLKKGFAQMYNMAKTIYINWKLYLIDKSFNDFVWIEYPWK